MAPTIRAFILASIMSHASANSSEQAACSVEKLGGDCRTMAADVAAPDLTMEEQGDIEIAAMNVSLLQHRRDMSAAVLTHSTMGSQSAPTKDTRKNSTAILNMRKQEILDELEELDATLHALLASEEVQGEVRDGRRHGMWGQ